MPSYGKLLEHRESKLALLQSTFNATNTCAARIGLSLVISAQFTFKMCVAAQNCEKNSLKPPILGFMVIDVGSPRKLVSSARFDMQQVCVYLQPLSR